jgi:hypothetical protein
VKHLATLITALCVVLDPEKDVIRIRCKIDVKYLKLNLTVVEIILVFGIVDNSFVLEEQDFSFIKTLNQSVIQII